MGVESSSQMCWNCLYQRLYARWYDGIVSRYEPRMQATRKQLLGGLPVGNLVEIGPGTGSNLAHLPQGSSWHGIEPNRYFHDGLYAKAAKLGLAARVSVAPGEQ